MPNVPARGAALATALAAVLAAAAAACRRPGPAPERPAPLPALAEDYCWWAVFRTPLPPDTVAARFAGAMEAAGLAGARWAREADTAWATAGPAVLADTSRGVAGGPAGPATYAARVVAFRRGDSTLYRHYVAVGPPPGGGQAPLDSADATRRRIPLCGALGRAAAVGGLAPREPDGEERRAVWGRGGR